MKDLFAFGLAGLRCGGFLELTNGSIGGSVGQLAYRFWGRGSIGVMADDGHHGEGEHDE